MPELLAATAVVTILLALSFSLAGQAMSRMQEATCASNLRQTGIVILLYAVDHDNTLPYVQANSSVYGEEGIQRHWRRAILPYIGLSPANDDVWKTPFICPPVRKQIMQAGNRGGIPGYGMNLKLENLSLMKVKNRSQTLMATEANVVNGVPSEIMTELIISRNGDGRHRNGANILYVDGHVNYFPRPTKLAEPPYKSGSTLDVWNP